MVFALARFLFIKKEQSLKLNFSFSNQQEAHRRDIMREMAGKLADQMSGELTAPEMQAVLEKHNGQLAQLEDKMLEEKEKQRRSLLEKLAQNRQKKLDALRWKHEQMVNCCR